MGRPIPKRLLIHSVEYQPPQDDGGWNSAPEPPVTISHVRISAPTTGEFVSRSAIKDNIEVRFVMFVDAVHSTPTVTIEERGKVTWNGQTYEVVRVSPMYGASRLHHVEVGLK
jgi:hypothetical protein